MKFPYVVRDRTVQGNFDQIATRLGFNQLKAGTAALTWAAGAALSNSPTVAHGLGGAPSQVLALINGTGGPDLVVVQAFTVGASTFQLQGGFRTGTWAAGGTIPCAWLAIR